MKEHPRFNRHLSAQAIVADFNDLPAGRKHLYFYLFLILLALLGDTIKRSLPSNRDPGNNVEMVR